MKLAAADGLSSYLSRDLMRTNISKKIFLPITHLVQLDVLGDILSDLVGVIGLP